MMEMALTNAQMREADEYTIRVLGISSEELMRRAGIAIAEEVEKHATYSVAGKITVVCGTGNNGGDGFVCASELLSHGFDVEIYLLNGRLSPDCEREKNRYKGRYSRDICGAIIVDCVFGTGLSRTAEGEYAEVIKKINASGAFVVSADMPSGLNGDNGIVLGCAVRANLTVAIAEYKAGMFLNDGLDLCGEIIRRDIGITCPQSEYIFVNNRSFYPANFPARPRNSHKGTYGTVNVIAGSEQYCGASVLNLQSALKSGCGYVKFTAYEKLKYALVTAYPQVIYIEDVDLKADCVLIGSGGGVSKELYERIVSLLKNYNGNLVIDADGLNSLAKCGVSSLKEKTCNVIITPHIKEFSRLTGKSVRDIEQNPFEYAQNFAKEYGVIVVLKSASTIVTDGKKIFLNVRGSTALAKAGSGDILAGFIAGTLARRVGLFDGACCAVQALGLSAEISSAQKTDYCATARDIIKNLHFSIKRLTQE